MLSKDLKLAYSIWNITHDFHKFDHFLVIYFFNIRHFSILADHFSTKIQIIQSNLYFLIIKKTEGNIMTNNNFCMQTTTSFLVYLGHAKRFFNISKIRQDSFTATNMTRCEVM